VREVISSGASKANDVAGVWTIRVGRGGCGFGERVGKDGGNNEVYSGREPKFGELPELFFNFNNEG
jgi:hypothetical protein